MWKWGLWASAFLWDWDEQILLQEGNHPDSDETDTLSNQILPEK